MKIDVQADVQSAIIKLGVIARSVVPAATVSALNRTATTARSVAVREIRGQASIKAAEVRKYVSLRKASRANMIATISARSHAPNLIRYAARKVKAGVSANAWRRRKVYRGAFIGNKGRTVFSRENPVRRSGPRTLTRHIRRTHSRTRHGRTFNVRSHPVGNGPRKKRERIKPLYGPSIRREFLREVCNRAMLKAIRERWPVEFGRELSYRMNARSAKIAADAGPSSDV